MKSSASAVWSGSLKEGKGTVSGASSAFSGLPYDFGKRFAGEPGTTPEEMIAAAHASCFAMATSAELGKAGITAESIAVTATVTLDLSGDAPTVTKSALDLVLTAPGADRAAAEKAANDAKAGCPISRLLAAAEITLAADIQT